VSRSIHRVWEIAPTPEHIVEDVTCSLTRAIDVVIAAKGIVVADLVMCSGRRGRRLDGKDKELSHKPRARQRKAALGVKPVHRDNRATYAALLGHSRNAAIELEAESSDDKAR
jgi:hypothetical protein